MYQLAHHSAFPTMPIDDEDVGDNSTAQLVKEVVCTIQHMTPLKESSPAVYPMSENFVLLAVSHKKLVEVSFSPTIIVINEN